MGDGADAEDRTGIVRNEPGTKQWQVSLGVMRFHLSSPSISVRTIRCSDSGSVARPKGQNR